MGGAVTGLTFFIKKKLTSGRSAAALEIGLDWARLHYSSKETFFNTDIGRGRAGFPCILGAVALPCIPRTDFS